MPKWTSLFEQYLELRDLFGPTEDELAELSGNLCNVICRDQLGIPEDDPFSHTSRDARRVALQVMDVLARHGLVD